MLLVFGAGVAAVHWVVTLPEMRHLGIGTAMTLAALREARTIGYRMPSSQPLLMERASIAA